MSHRWKNHFQDGPRHYLDQGLRQHQPSDILFHTPPKVYRELLRDPLMGGLVATGAGAFVRSAYHLVERPKGFPCHNLHLVLEGEGWLEVPSHPTLSIRAPALLWITGREPHRYGSRERNPWTIWHLAGFGPTMDLFHRRLHLKPGECQVPLRFTEGVVGRLNDLFQDVLRAFQTKDKGFGPFLTSARLRVALVGLAELLHSNREHAGLDASRLKQFLARHARENLSLKRMSEGYGMEPRAFSRLVKENLQESPMAFRNRLRVEEARVLLAGGATVTEAALQVGCQDALYFSRVFKNVTGHSPRQERLKP